MSLTLVKALLILNAKAGPKKGSAKAKGWTDEARRKAALTRKAKSKVAESKAPKKAAKAEPKKKSKTSAKSDVKVPRITKSDSISSILEKVRLANPNSGKPIKPTVKGAGITKQELEKANQYVSSKSNHVTAEAIKKLPPKEKAAFQLSLDANRTSSAQMPGLLKAASTSIAEAKKKSTATFTYDPHENAASIHQRTLLVLKRNIDDHVPGKPGAYSEADITRFKEGIKAHTAAMEAHLKLSNKKKITGPGKSEFKAKSGYEISDAIRDLDMPLR